MTLEPIFGRIFVEPLKTRIEQSILFVKFEGYRDRGRVYNSGSSQLVKTGDLVKYNIRRARDIKLKDLCLVSVDEEDIECIITEETNVKDPIT